MRRKFIGVVVGILFILGASFAGAQDLTGVWNCNDEGKYYLRQIGKELWWYGESNPVNPNWSNVATGVVEKGELKLKWADVPKGSIANSGTLVIKVISKNKLQLKSQTGDFGGSEWTRAAQE